MGQGRAGQKGQWAAMGQGHYLGPQQVQFALLHLVQVAEQTHRSGRGQTAGGGGAVEAGLHGPQGIPAQGIQHPGIHAVPAAHFRHLEQPAEGGAGAAPGLLGRGPLPGRQAHIAEQRQHFAGHLSPGQAQEQAIAGEGRQLGVGGHVCIAVDQVVAQKAVGAVALLNFLPGAAVDGIAHGISHRQSQQHPAKLSFLIRHARAPFQKLCLLYLLAIEFARESSLQTVFGSPGFINQYTGPSGTGVLPCGR